jgi:hypothetical protein
LVQPFWRAVWQYISRNTEIFIPFNLTNAFLENNCRYYVTGHRHQDVNIRTKTTKLLEESKGIDFVSMVETIDFYT